jgi:hypothetical protein
MPFGRGSGQTVTNTQTGEVVYSGPYTDEYGGPPIPNPSGARNAGMLKRFGEWSGDKIDKIWRRFTGEAEFDFNKALADHQADRDIEFWNMVNEYNSPEEIVRRLQEAGLSPGLMYTGGASAGMGNAKDTPKYQGHPARLNSDIFAGLKISQAFQDIRMKNAQIDLVKANTEKSIAQKLSEGVRKTLLGTQADLARIKVKFEREAYSDRMEMISNLNKKYNAEWERLNRQVKGQDIINLREMQHIIEQNLKIQMRKFGLTDSDPFWSRLIAMGAYQQGYTAGDLHGWMQQLKSVIKQADDLGDIMNWLLGPGQSQNQFQLPQ